MQSNLDRLEALLVASQERHDREMAEIRANQQASAERFNRIEDTLDRTTTLQTENTISIRELQQSIRDGFAETRQEIKANIDDVSAMIFEGLSETKTITDSNARAVQAWESRIQEGVEDSEEIASSMVAAFGQRIEDAIGNVLGIVGSLARRQDALAQQQQQTDLRFNNLLEEARADRQQAQANAQRFNTLLEEAQADRQQVQAAREQWQLQAQANDTEHRAFRQNIQVLLAEIARLWERLAS